MRLGVKGAVSILVVDDEDFFERWGALTAIDPATGEVAWEYTTPYRHDGGVIATALDEAIDTFLGGATDANLEAAKQAWLAASDDYGPTKLDYPLFADDDPDARAPVAAAGELLDPSVVEHAGVNFVDLPPRNTPNVPAVGVH